MPLPSPNLDDRSYADLRREALEVVAKLCPEWTDLSASDPGITLLEVFAYLTEALLYRLNRLPEKAYVAFLNLVGIRQQAPAAAIVVLELSLAAPTGAAVRIPRGTTVTVDGARGDSAPVFTTLADATIAAGSRVGTVRAVNAELVSDELIGTASGRPAQQMAVGRPPIVLATDQDLGLRLLVEVTAEELAGRPAGGTIDGRPFREWKEVDAFVDLGDDREVFLADRLEGVITFAPALRQMGPPPGGADTVALLDTEALAATPKRGRQVRASYWRGGGVAGNVAAGVLTRLISPPLGVDLRVTNPRPAVGGRDGESFENAMQRGPQELHRFNRAVTARDYELAALQTGLAGRAKASAKRTEWRHAERGTVQVLLVPVLSAEAVVGASARDYIDRQTDEALVRVARFLDDASILGTTLEVAWAHYKPVSVRATVVLHHGENVAVVERRLLVALRSVISPLPAPSPSGAGDNRPPVPAAPAGWPFGQRLRASDVYDVLLRDAGVRYVENLEMQLGVAPSAISTITADPNQPETWYCGSAGSIFRSMDDGTGWDPVATLDGVAVEVVRTHPNVPGLVLVAGVVAKDTTRSEVWASRDCGESWVRLKNVDHVNDIAILQQPQGDVAFLASDTGLFRLSIPASLRGVSPDLVSVLQLRLPDQAGGRGVYAVAVCDYDRGPSSVAASLKGGDYGIVLSHANGDTGTFLPPTATGFDIRRLCLRVDSTRRYLLGAVTAQMTEQGVGAIMTELVGAETNLQPRWSRLDTGWQGGGCEDLAVDGDWLVAGSHRHGVLRLNLAASNPAWTESSKDCLLPRRDEPDSPFEPVEQIAIRGSIVLAAAAQHLYKMADVTITEDRWAPASESSFTDQVTLSPGWLFTSGDHVLDVVL